MSGKKTSCHIFHTWCGCSKTRSTEFAQTWQLGPRAVRWDSQVEERERARHRAMRLCAVAPEGPRVQLE
eukprot:7002132-Alexandrium_andersonii.AAC.1